MTIDEALEDLAAAMTGAGIPLWHPPDSLDDLAEVQAAIAPLRLPDDLRRFWTLVDAWTMQIEPEAMQFVSPGYALESWRANQEFPGFRPRVLLDLAGESNGNISVELSTGELDSGALFEWWIDGGGFGRLFNGIVDWIAHIAGLIRQGHYRRSDFRGTPRWTVPASRRVVEPGPRLAPPGTIARAVRPLE